MDVAALIAPLLNGSHAAGVIAHFVTGTIVFPVIYLVFGIRWLPGPGWLRGALFLIPLYLGAMVVIMPLLGQGLFFGSAPKAMVALMGHIVFGLAVNSGADLLYFLVKEIRNDCADQYQGPDDDHVIQ